jgi:hypothetical protein
MSRRLWHSPALFPHVCFRKGLAPFTHLPRALVVDFGKVEAPQLSNTGEVPGQVLFSDLRDVKLAQVATPGEVKDHVNESQVTESTEGKLMKVASLQERLSVGTSAYGDDDGRDSMALPGMRSAPSTDPAPKRKSLLLGTAGISHSPPPTNRTNRTNRTGRRGTFKSERHSTEEYTMSNFTPRQV